ncbi:MAG: HPF/RaiA family ribosome-associated protein [Pseudomonadota bacterium]
MQVQVETDNHIPNRDELARYVESVVLDKAGRFQDQISSVQVHLHDDNSPDKKGDNDFRCLMEARLSRLKPVAVNQHADNLHQAINGAGDKLARALDSTLGKLEDRKRHAVGLGHLSAPGTDLPPSA